MYTSKQILDTYWDKLIPVNPLTIAHKIGIIVVSDSSTNAVNSIKRDVDGKHTITLKAECEYLLRRFVIAHQIGHYALGHLNEHRNLLNDDQYSYSTMNLNPFQIEANVFATELLIPEATLMFAVSDRGYRTTASLAKLFHVSEVAMSLRLRKSYWFKELLK